MFNIYNYLTTLSPIIRMNLDRADDIANSFSATQFKSKKWLVDELAKINLKPNPNVLILGGWYGSLLIPMLKESNVGKITLTDIDSRTVEIAKQLHDCSAYVLNADQPTHQFDTDIVINTSCEHMSSIGEYATSNPKSLFVLQSCDNDNDPGHVNVAIDTDDFVTKTGLTTILFKGRMNLGHKNRFMVIGYK